MIGTASARNHELLRGLGADELIDYRTADFAETVRDVDVVLDPVGGDYQARSLRTLRRGMLIALVPLQPGVADQAAQGKLRPVIAGAFPLAEAAKAHEIGDGGHVAGKLVLTMR